MRKLVRSVVVIAIAAISSPAFASQAGGAPHPPFHALSQGGRAPSNRSPRTLGSVSREASLRRGLM